MIMVESTHSQQSLSAKNLRINIGRKQRLVRGPLGLVVLGITAAVAVQIVQEDLILWWHLLFLVLLQNGLMLIMEWDMGVCPVNAIRGKKSMTGWFSIGKEDVEDSKRLKAARQAARKQWVLSTLTAVVVTAILLLFQ